MAGYMSGAVYEQSQREAQGLPILSGEEISTIARLATTDNYGREGEVGQVHQYFNQASFAITEYGGHGIFNPDMFRDLIDEAYHIIERNPDITRGALEIKVEANQSNLAVGEATFTAENLEENIVVESVRFEFYPDSVLTPEITVGGLGEEDGIRFVSNHADESFVANPTNFAWMRLETDFGEVASNGSQWSLGIDDDTMTDASVTVYGYPEGGLIHRMMDYAQEIAPSPETPKPEVDLKQDEQSQEREQSVPLAPMPIPGDGR